MTFFKINRKIFDKETEWPNSPHGRSLPGVSGKEIKSQYIKILFETKEINRNRLIPKDLPPIDYFICYEMSGDKEIDWVLLDAYYIAYDSKYSKISISGWLISPKFKELLIKGKYTLGVNYTFHPAKLRFQGEYLDYYLFQYIYPSLEYFALDKTTLDYKNQPELVGDTLAKKAISKYSREMKYKDLHQDRVIHYRYTKYSDLLFVFYSKNYVISERLKKDIEINGITGFEFSPIDIFKLSFKDKKIPC